MAGLYTEVEIDDLDKVRDTRHAMVAVLMKGGVPEDKESSDILLKTLKDMETSAFAKAKLRQQTKTDESEGELKGAMVELLKQIRPAEYMVSGSQNTNIPDALPGEYDVVPVEGELTQGVDDNLIERFRDLI